MTKRIVSLVLCLILVLGIVTPVVNAADDSTVSWDNVTFSDVTIDGNTVNSTTSVTSPTQLGSTASTETVATTAPDCDCGNEGKDVIIHADSCMLKKYYQGICKQSSLAIWGMWSDLPTDAREYILAYLSWTDNAKLQELEDRLSTGAFAEDSITVDGTEITAVNIPEIGSLSVTAPSASAQTAVQDYLTAQGDSSDEQLFMWDISVVTTSGQEWQPDGTPVKLELDVSDVTLHKYATVYVVHVDDEGNTSQIPAQVTEDGKIAFETTGFSTFAAFTVDFAFDGAEFSIPGETSIKLSEVFDQLKMPLFVSDVANVTFSDTSLVTVEKQSNGDWLLTSLVEFHTDEKLTVTMNDGEVYVIDVTDATYVTISYNNSGNLDGGTLGVVEWNLLGSGSDGQAYASRSNKNSYAPGWTEDYDIYIDGTNATNKDFEIVLQRHDTASGRILYLDLHTIHIKGGANLIFRLGGTITKENTDQVIVRQVRGYKNDDGVKPWWFAEMFWVEDGSLNLYVPYTAVAKGGDGGSVHEGVQMVFDWDQQYYQTQYDLGNKPKPLVSLRQNATSFKANQCLFRDVGHTGDGDTLTAVAEAEAAIVCRSDGLSEFTMTNCVFQNTNKTGGNGSGIYLMSNVADSKAGYTLIHNFTLTNCTFTNCKAGGSGGAVSLRGYVHNGSISGCTFTGCTSGSYGGAVELAGNIGSFSISNSTFTNCTSTQRGGAVAIRSIEIKNSSDVPRWTRSNAITFSGCTFTNCDATSNHGGGIGAQAQIHTLTVSDCDFKDCDTNGANGGGISIDGADLPDTFKDSTVTNYPDWTAEISSCTTCAGNEHALGTVMGGNFNWTNKVDTSKTVDHKSWVNTVNITNGCTFDNCTAISRGGAIEFAEGCYVTNQATISGATISNCKAVNEGSAIFWSTCIVKSMSLKSSTFENCSFTGTSTDAGGTVKTTGKSTMVLSVDGCIFRNNTTHHNGGGLYWNANRNLEGVVCSATVNDCLFDTNTAAIYGGGIYVESDITITKCDIKNNTAGQLGGGIAQQVYNNPGARMLDEGGVSELKLDPNTWVHNNTATNGGGISIRANETGSITDGEPIAYTVRFELNGAAVYQNTASNNGGGIYFIAETSSDPLKQAEVDKYTKEILINAGTGTAAAVYKNTANNHGGGVYMESSENTELRIQGGYISGNHADKDGDGTGNGGGIYMTGKNATCYVEGGTVGGEGNDSAGVPLSNTAVKGGGIAISGGAKIEMIIAEGATEGGEISYNKATSTTATEKRRGGGIWLDNGTSELYNSIKIEGGTITHNTADDEGGGVHVGVRAQFQIDGGSITYNTAELGGGVSMHEAWGDAVHASAVINGGTVSNNTASDSGGAFFGHYYAYITINDGTISNNTATNGSGGGILNRFYGKLTITGGLIEQNHAAQSNGGGVYLYKCSGEITGGNIQNNDAKDGSGIWMYGWSLAITGGNILSNTASGNGGGIYADDSATVTVGATETTHGTISHNEASNGGGIYAINGADVTITNGYLTYNKANGKPDASITTALHRCTALKGTGGGVFLASGKEAADESSTEDLSTFTLTGDTYAIYGNLAEFAADDVFSNGENTKLNVPKVADMDLSEYKFKPEGWFEDYPTDDTAYSSGLNLAAVNSGIGDGEGEHVYRYRNADPMQRVLISDNSGVALVNTADTYVAMTLGMPTAVNDTVVIDYGKPVDIHVLTNEVMTIANATLIGIGPLFDHVENVYGYEDEPDSDYVQTVGEVYSVLNGGTAVMLADGEVPSGVVRYTLGSMSMTKEAAFSYVVKYTNSTTKDANGNEVNEYFYYYADVTIIPATTIYYEDDFQINTTNGIQYGVYDATSNESLTSGGWTNPSDGTNISMIQNEDRPGAALETAIDKDNVYGYDSHYTTGLQYSLGNAKMVTVDASKYATATFSFYGTGFDVISMTSANTGTIGVIVSKYSDDGSSLTVVENYLVDTYYGYKFEGGKWVVDTESTDALYQVPVIKVNCKDGYGHYQVKIVVTYADFFNHKGDSSYDFYLDAIRIYDPANDGTGNTVIQDAYTDDGEGWPSYSELRNMLINLDTFNSTGDTDTINGVVFIDGIPALNNTTADKNTSVRDENKNELDKTAEIKTYMNFGPNNELYLAKGQAVAFTLNNPTTLASVQIAMKSVGSSSVPVKISYYDATTKTLVKFKEFAKTTDKDESIATATDLYYDISDLAGKTVVIQNTSTTDGPILSITNIKTTYTEQPSGTFRLLRTTPAEAESMLAALNAVEEEQQPEQQPEQNVPGSDVEENPVTGDMVFETLMLTVMTACVMMLVVLALPKARKRNAK